MKVDGSTHRGTATPRWDWSGVDQLITPTISDGDMARIVESLPACRSTPEEIKSKIQALGARYHRYLHQDEFGPTRAEKMSALQRAGIHVVKSPADIGTGMQQALGARSAA